MAGALLLLAVLWAYRFTPALGVNSVDGWADVAGARVTSLGELGAQVFAPLTQGVAGDNANFYRPIAMLWFSLLRGGFGTWGAGWQGADLGLHLLCVTLVGGLSRKMGGSDWEALGAAALVGLHPLGMDVVPALDRSPDMLGTAFVLGALLASLGGRVVLAVLLALLAVGSKETMLSALPLVIAVLWDRHGARKALGAFGGLAAGTALYLALRTWVLGGAGGYVGAFLRPAGLQVVLESGALELVAAGWALPLEEVFTTTTQQILVGSTLTALLLGAGWAGRDEVNVRVGVLLALLPLLLLGVTSAFSRRTIYLPLCGFGVYIAAVVARAPWGKLVGVVVAGLLLPNSPLVRKDRAWTLAAAMDRSLTLGVVDAAQQVPAGQTLWMVDRCVQVDTDPWMAGMWRQGRSSVYCAAGYSVEAYLQDQLGTGLQIKKITNSFPVAPPEPATLRVEGPWLWVDRADPERRSMRVARDAGWEVDRQRDSLGLRAGGELEQPWVLVAGVEDGILVQAP
ncbi:MAG: hypothetical protein VX899_14815 [Myxococcota bacterium]|nr:hypothetical protein [Myxococcota bacterium]